MYCPISLYANIFKMTYLFAALSVTCKAENLCFAVIHFIYTTRNILGLICHSKMHISMNGKGSSNICGIVLFPSFMIGQVVSG